MVPNTDVGTLLLRESTTAAEEAVAATGTLSQQTQCFTPFLSLINGTLPSHELFEHTFKQVMSESICEKGGNRLNTSSSNAHPLTRYLEMRTLGSLSLLSARFKIGASEMSNNGGNSVATLPLAIVSSNDTGVFNGNISPMARNRGSVSK